MSSMTFDQYAERRRKTIRGLPKDEMERLSYAFSGLAGETGEVHEAFKRLLVIGIHPREGESETTKSLRASLGWQLVDELGDVLWYLADVADQIRPLYPKAPEQAGVTLESIARVNLVKVEDKYA